MRECPVCQACFPDALSVCDRDGAATTSTLPIEPFINRRYLLKRRIGGGSVSVVYAATDKSNGRECALKIILPDLIRQDATVSERFLRLARNAFALRHANIVSVTDSGLINGLLPFLTMDLVAGSSLQDVLAKGRRLSPAEVAHYVTAIGAGLSHAHRHDVVHGDLKPRNILIEDKLPLSQALKIADFALSALKSGKVHSRTDGKSSGILRSPVYLAPEEWSEQSSDSRSDIYSLGVIVYQMLTGEVPFKGKSIPAIMRAHLVEPPPGISGRFPELSHEIESVVLNALEKDPRNRPATIDSFLEEFGGAIMSDAAAEEEHQEPLPMMSAFTQSLLLALGVVVVLTLIGIGVYYSRASQ